MKYIFEFFVVAAIIAVVNAGCVFNTKNISTTPDFITALNTAKPGDIIVLQSGKYDIEKTKEFVMHADGLPDCPITITCKHIGEATVVGMLNITSSRYVNIYNITVFGEQFGISSDGGKYLYFQNVHLDQKEKRGIRLVDSSLVTVRNCTFTNMHYAGIIIKNSSQVTLIGNTFGEEIWTMAVWLFAGASDNVITENAFYGSDYLYFAPAWINIYENCTRNEVSRNVFINTDDSVMGQGVCCHPGSSDNVFKENFMVINKGADGFHVAQTKQTVCASNKVFGEGTFTDGPIDMSC